MQYPYDQFCLDLKELKKSLRHLFRSLALAIHSLRDKFINQNLADKLTADELQQLYSYLQSQYLLIDWRNQQISQLADAINTAQYIQPIQQVHAPKIISILNEIERKQVELIDLLQQIYYFFKTKPPDTKQTRNAVLKLVMDVVDVVNEEWTYASDEILIAEDLLKKLHQIRRGEQK